MNANSAYPRVVDIVADKYDHTQHAPMYWLVLLPAIVIAAIAIIVPNDIYVAIPMLLVSGVLVATAMSFRWLRVVDEGTHLAMRFGPLPLLRKRILYANIVAAVRDRSSIIDGWGMHWLPGRGWTYNLSGFDCVRLTLKGGGTARIGTDDPDGLTQFLQQKLREIE
jgi:hypothetical protein